MPTTTRNGVSLYYECEGDGETVAFIDDLGYGAWQWGWQYDALAGPFETLVWDLRGTGQSDTPEGPYDVAQLAADLEAVLSDAGARTAHLVGCGLGGMVALEHARRYGRAKTLTLLGTSSGGPDADLPAEPRTSMFAPPDDERALRSSLEPVFSADFRESHPEALDRIAEWRADDDAERAGWEAQERAFATYEHEGPLYETTLPTLVVHGAEDRVVPPSNAEALAEGLPKAELEIAPDAGHLVGIEYSAAVNDRLLGFLEEHGDVDL
ncbi:Pimeloyl-ACP methyl ester carboxylesterase [Natronoarchaeum philippinense]|uniref:Pimeloyl-ACP methyl ester carboxylesterase n=1 Tax=Natronoarchaeum philippinense TaxID=558529 RepID=A0A285NT45_NATPI|nr:alpha/beta fold hydrolase [Natronoarchaeum philippinense]SNZ12157.1 Pimeloyl-ACP methyl ester carboxylesterase [Natronoarchaeum philippinense]